MSKSNRHSITVLAVGILAAALFGSTFLLGLGPKLGLDLRGGLSVTLTAPEGTPEDELLQAVEILRQRVDRAGVAEPEISTQGSENVFVQLPGTDEPERLLELIGRTAQLQFRPVERILRPGDPEYETADVVETAPSEDAGVFVSGEDDLLYQLGPAEVTGDAIRQATAQPVELNWHVLIDFNSADVGAWREFTGRLACNAGVQRQVAIVMDGVVESSPGISPNVMCNEGIEETSITGNFTEGEAKDLALVLTAGALPVELTQSEVRTVSATLGSDALKAGLLAGAIGLVLVMLYMLLYYRALGLQTWLSLIVFGMIIYGLVVYFGELIGWNLTLSGIAGLIVAVGIATDSNIVFYERIKEELHSGRSLRVAVDRGFASSWRTMRAANLITIMAALVLYVVAVGPVRGFAFALGMATALDLVLVYVLTWPLAALLARNRFFSDNPVLGMRRAMEGGAARGSFMNKMYRSDFKIDFIGRRRTWFTASAVLVAVSAVALIPAVRGLNYGIDFQGGSIYMAPVSTDVTAPQIIDAMSEAGLEQPLVQILEDRAGGNPQAQVQTSSNLEPDERSVVIEALTEVTGARSGEVNIEAVGEKWGANITVKALRGLGIFLLVAIGYISWRLEPKMAAAGILALLHDLVITAGIYAIVGFEVSPATVIALLTILGYSLYDTVVVFDRIQEEENLPANAKSSFAEIANSAANQMLMRSISTSLSTLLPVGSLLFVGSILLGAETLQDLALALFVGIIASAYSSIYLATPALSVWKEREPRYALAQARRRRSGKASRSRELPEEVAEDDGAEEDLQDAPDVKQSSQPSTEAQTPAATKAASKTQPTRKQSRAKRKKGKGKR
ncbi:MAG: protein translocase subunit SecD [Actinomycetota bacterium]